MSHPDNSNNPSDPNNPNSPNSPNSPNNSSDQALQQALEQAAHWHALLESGSATKADRQRWQQWLDASEQHRIAWGYVQRVSRRFAGLQGPDARRAADAHHSVNSQLLSRRSLLSVLVMAGTGTVGWATWRHTDMADTLLAWRADQRSATGEVRHIALADGSALWLSSASAVNLHFDQAQRRIELLRGEVLVQTAADAAQRPFSVQTVHGELRAQGTRFSVRLGDAQSQLAVFQGAVQITTHGSAIRTTVAAGQQTRFDAQTIEAVQQADPNREVWSRRIFIAQRTPLHVLVEELRHHHAGRIGLAPEVANLPVLGSYPLTDTAQTLRMLERVLPIRVRQPLPWWISIGSR